MRNPRVRRWAAALLNLLFLLAWGEPVSLHPCPTHDGVAVAAMAHAGHGGHAAHDAGASHGSSHGSSLGSSHGDSHGASHAMPAQPGHDADGTSHACQCLGECSVGAAVALPGAVAVAWQASIRHAAEPPLAEPAAPSAAAPRLLPFPNGPPGLA